MLRCFSEDNKKFLDLSKYEMVKQIEDSSYSAVYLMKEISTRYYYVFRILNIPKYKPKAFFEFINIVKLIDLPSFNKIYYCDYLSNFKNFSFNIPENRFNGDSLLMVVDYIQNNNLNLLTKKYLDGDNSLITPTIRNKIIFGVANAMKFLHKHNILHRDLKTDHILLDKNFEPIVTFCSCSQFMTKDEYFESNVGTPLYSAPECIKMDDSIGFPSDVYSYSIFLYRLFNPDIQFEHGRDINKLSIFSFCKKILKGERFVKPKNIPECFWNLIKCCWDQNPDDRPTFDQIVTELKKDEYALDEFGVKTNLDELHEYQNRVEKNIFIL